MPSQPLKHLARRKITFKDINKYYATVHDMSDETAAVSSATLVERRLEELIASRMRKRMSKTDYAELFVGGMAPLSSFSSKIKVAYALGIVGKRGLLDLNKIKDIRNQFAHSFHSISFKTKAVAEACRNLRTPEAGYDALTEKERAGIVISRKLKRDPKTRYTTACSFLWIALSLRGLRGPRPRIKRDRISRSVLQ
jgi:hypothetical protein